MNEDIVEKTITNEDNRNYETRELFESYNKDPKKLDDINLHAKLTQELKTIQAQNDIQLMDPISCYLEEAYNKVETYKLHENSPFRILADSKAMLLRNGLITIGAKAKTGKTSLATHLAIEIMKSNPKTCFIFFSLDDSRALGIKRILSQITKTSYITTDPSLLKEIKSQDLIDNFAQNIVIIDEKTTTERIRPSLDIMKQRGYENLIVCIDYLQLLDSKYTSSDDKRRTLNNSLREVKKYKKIQIASL